MRGSNDFSSLRKAARLGGASILAASGLLGSALIEDGGARARETAGLFNPGALRQPGIQNRVIRSRNRQPDRRLRGKPSTKKVEKHKETPPPAGPHLLIISVKSQRVSLYANGNLVVQSPVSTGTATNPTPHGVFSIIQRNRHHRSNIYSGAPMPYMQRLTWSGVALHQGVLPGYPASHGCIRLPEQFASFLWRTTKLGARVVVAREDVEPQEITHARLFQPKPVPTTVENLPQLRKTLDTTTPAFVRTAGMTLVITDASAEPAEAEDAKTADSVAVDNKPALTQATPAHTAETTESQAGDSTRESVEPSRIVRQDDRQIGESASRQAAESKGSDSVETAKAKTEVSIPAGPELASARPEEPAAAATAVTSEQPTKALEAAHEPNPGNATASILSKADIPEAILASFAQSLQAKQKKAPPSGPVSVFISRKDKRIYVRQSFIPLFTAPVTIRDDMAFGTHVFTALDKDGDEKRLRWVVITLPTDAPKAKKSKPQYRIDARGRRIEVAAKPLPAAAPPAPPSATSVLDRIDIPQDVVDRISEYVTVGASLIVSDHGLGYETGLYTDFIVVTR